VRKVWIDDNNAQNIRPEQVVMTLSNGLKVILSEENGWTATVSDLPARTAEGDTIRYTWTEQDVIGYTRTGITTEGAATVITNTVWERPEKPTQGKPPKVPGNQVYTFEDYDTPLGVEVSFNHVGDCFD